MPLDAARCRSIPMPLDADDFKHPEFPTSMVFPKASQFTSRSIPLDLLLVLEVVSTPLDLVALGR
jgi:hypothetical protein